MPTSSQADGKMDQLNQMPVGTGPFTVRRLPAGCGDPLQDAIADYWGKAPKIDDLIFAITDRRRRCAAQKLKAGECQIMPYPNPADVAATQGGSEPQRSPSRKA